MRPGPSGFFVTAGETMSTGVSSNLKMRSLAAIADCRMLYFSLKSMMGRKKRMRVLREGDQHAQRGRGRDQVKRHERLAAELDETLLATMPRITSCPPNQITQAIAIAEKKSTTG